MLLFVSCVIAVWASLQSVFSDDQLAARARVGMLLGYLDLAVVWFRLPSRWLGCVVSFFSLLSFSVCVARTLSARARAVVRVVASVRLCVWPGC